jgi:GT2 family glycosyltransferase
VALDDAGLFDERYFNYLEDADLAWRLRLLGWRCLLVPQARVRHIYSATSGQGSAFKQRLLARNRLRLIARCFPYSLLRRHWFAILCYDLLAMGYALLKGQPAIITGRLAVIRELPDLLGTRRRMLKRKRVPSDELDRWLAPAVTVRDMLGEQRALNDVLQQR